MYNTCFYFLIKGLFRHFFPKVRAYVGNLGFPLGIEHHDANISVASAEDTDAAVSGLSAVDVIIRSLSQTLFFVRLLRNPRGRLH